MVGRSYYNILLCNNPLLLYLNKLIKIDKSFKFLGIKTCGATKTYILVDLKTYLNIVDEHNWNKEPKPIKNK